MQSQTESVIAQQWRAQITPARYVINNDFNNFEYTMINKVSANTVNLLNLSIYNAFPNLNLAYRNLKVQVLGVQYPIILPNTVLNNFYSIFTMLPILETQLNLQTPYVWTLVVAGNQNKFVNVSTTQPFNFIYAQQLPANQIARYLGFGNPEDDIYNIYQPKTTFLSEFPFNVQVTQNINVQIRGVGELNSETVACLAQIPIGAIDTLISWQSPFYQFARQIIDKHNAFAVSRIVVSLLDDLSVPLVVLDNRISLTLLLERFEKA